MSVIRVTDLNLKGKRVLIRSDLNVPVKDGVVTSDARISASMKTFEHCLKAGAKVIVMSHLGRPTEGEYSEENSLKPVADTLSTKLGKSVRLIKDWLDGVTARHQISLVMPQRQPPAEPDQSNGSNNEDLMHWLPARAARANAKPECLFQSSQPE